MQYKSIHANKRFNFQPINEENIFSAFLGLFICTFFHIYSRIFPIASYHTGTGTCGTTVPRSCCSGAFLQVTQNSFLEVDVDVNNGRN